MLTAPSPLNGVTIAVRTSPSMASILRGGRLEPPKVAGEADSGENRFRLSGGTPVPIGIEAVRVPGLGEAPQLLGREDCASREAVQLAPTVDVLFRPEGKHRRSGEPDVL